MSKYIKFVKGIYEIADRKYRLSTTMFAGTFLALILTLWAYRSALNEIDVHHEEFAKLESRVADYEGCRNPTPSFNPPLRINFSDGRVARASYHVSFAPVLEKYSDLKEDEDMLHQILHNRTERLDNFLQSKVYGELEVHSFDYVTRNRAAVSQRILEAAKPLYEELDYMILELNLLEICEVRALGAPHAGPSLGRP